MTEQEIKDNAPSGATHYHATKHGAIYLKKGKFLFFTTWKEWNSLLFIWTDSCLIGYFDKKPL